MSNDSHVKHATQVEVLTWMATDLAKLHVIVSDALDDSKERDEGMRLLGTLTVAVGALLMDAAKDGAL